MPIELSLHQVINQSAEEVESLQPPTSPRFFYFGGRLDWMKYSDEANEVSFRPIANFFKNPKPEIYIVTQNDLLNQDMDFWLREFVKSASVEQTSPESEEIEEAFESLAKTIFNLDENKSFDELLPIFRSTNFIGFSYGCYLIKKLEKMTGKILESQGFTEDERNSLMSQVKGFNIGPCYKIDKEETGFNHVHFLLSNDYYAAYFCNIAEREVDLECSDIFSAIFKDIVNCFGQKIPFANPNIKDVGAGILLSHYKGKCNLIIQSTAKGGIESFDLKQGAEVEISPTNIFSCINNNDFTATPSDPEHHSLWCYANVTGVRVKSNGRLSITLQQNGFAHLLPYIFEQAMICSGQQLLEELPVSLAGQGQQRTFASALLRDVGNASTCFKPSL